MDATIQNKVNRSVKNLILKPTNTLMILLTHKIQNIRAGINISESELHLTLNGEFNSFIEVHESSTKFRYPSQKQTQNFTPRSKKYRHEMQQQQKERNNTTNNGTLYH